MGEFITQNIFPIIALVVSGGSALMFYRSDADVTKEKVKTLRKALDDLSHEVNMCKVQHVEHYNFQKQVIDHMATVRTENEIMKTTMNDLKAAAADLVTAVNELKIAVTKIKK